MRSTINNQNAYYMNVGSNQANYSPSTKSFTESSYKVISFIYRFIEF
jgi:hypothetical protein